MDTGVDPAVSKHEIGTLVQLSVGTGSSRRFQPGEGPNRGLLCDCKTWHNLRQPSFQALVQSTGLQEDARTVTFSDEKHCYNVQHVYTLSREC